MRHVTRCIIASVIMGMSVWSSSVSAQSFAARENEWQFIASLYGWMSGMSGDTTVKGVDASIDASFGDVLENLDLAFMGSVEAQKGKWGLFLEPMYTGLSKDAKAGPADIDVELSSWIVDFGGAYQIYSTARETLDDQGMFVDVLAGGRFISTAVDLEVVHVGSVDKSVSWVDPMIGARLWTNFTPKFGAILRGDIGGFGLGSNFAWNLKAYGVYQFTPSFGLFAGYRVLDYDYEDGDGSDKFATQLTLNGPVIGVGFLF